MFEQDKFSPLCSEEGTDSYSSLSSYGMEMLGQCLVPSGVDLSCVHVMLGLHVKGILILFKTIKTSLKIYFSVTSKMAHKTHFKLNLGPEMILVTKNEASREHVILVTKNEGCIKIASPRIFNRTAGQAWPPRFSIS